MSDSNVEKRFKALFKNETGANGKFERDAPYFRIPFGKGEGENEPASGRYRLLVSKACPWAHRQLIARELLGLKDAISVGVVDPVRPKKDVSDWAFTLDEGGVDPVLGIGELSEVYFKSAPDYPGRFTVPCIVDLETGLIANNDFHNLTYYLERAFAPFQTENENSEYLRKIGVKNFQENGAIDLLPEDPRDIEGEIKKVNAIIFNDINNGVYKCGFAATQEAYEESYDAIFARLDEFEKRLVDSRFLFGDKLTDSDIRLWVTLARFDAAYYNAFRVNRNRLVDFKNLWRYARELYRIPAFKKTTDFEHIKKHYHLCCVPSNEYLIVPKGPDLSIWEEDFECKKI